MIRNATNQVRSRLGLVQMGSGGSSGDFIFIDGLSSDPRLAIYLQDLTPAQLQSALNGEAPTAADMGASDVLTLASCSDPATYDPAICGPGGAGAHNPLAMNNLIPSLGNVPTWVWLAGSISVVGLILGGRR